MQESGPSQKYIQANHDNLESWIHHFAACINRFEPQVLHLLSGRQIFAPNHPWMCIPPSLITPLLKLVMALCLRLGKWVGKVIECQKTHTIIGNKSEKNARDYPLTEKIDSLGDVLGWVADQFSE